MEDEILEPTPETAPDMPGQSDPSPAETNNDTESANLVNTGLPELSGDPVNEEKDETLEEISPQDDAAVSPEPTPGVDDQEQIGEDQTDEETDTGEDVEAEDDGGTTNITIIRPPVQITYQADEDATYHTIIDNAETDPVPVVVVETLIEKELGIMDKRLEDYTVTEGLLLFILLTLWLRMIFDYSGRRKS
ncbi:MAG: hypothetical protein K2N41_04115 [Lachnospiraceae bacterium]|nr:hypothetical protein [Lachnospiraceae bacterium]MDE7238879.1 hypothetical protein [Lachnospiraceae bacterium]